MHGFGARQSGKLETRFRLLLVGASTYGKLEKAGSMISLVFKAQRDLVRARDLIDRVL